MMGAATVDGRRMNNMDAETKIVHLRLEAWGRWAKEHQAAWPASTVLARIIECGANGASQSGRPPTSMPEPIAQTDAAVARLHRLDQAIVVTYYARWEPIEVMAHRHNLGMRQFQNVLRRARWRLGAWLT
jgi:hypothetical protein